MSRILRIYPLNRTSEGASSLAIPHWLAGCSALAFVTLIVAYFHNRFWWPPDDGASAYVASRLLAGDVLNVDIRDVHPGYVHFIHAAALKIFGEDIVSL